jgi:hypothetical protein
VGFEPGYSAHETDTKTASHDKHDLVHYKAFWV